LQGGPVGRRRKVTLVSFVEGLPGTPAPAPLRRARRRAPPGPTPPPGRRPAARAPRRRRAGPGTKPCPDLRSRRRSRRPAPRRRPQGAPTTRTAAAARRAGGGGGGAGGWLGGADNTARRGERLLRGPWRVIGPALRSLLTWCASLPDWNGAACAGSGPPHGVQWPSLFETRKSRVFCGRAGGVGPQGRARQRPGWAGRERAARQPHARALTCAACAAPRALTHESLCPTRPCAHTLSRAATR
jgi:hypothetical protein